MVGTYLEEKRKKFLKDDHSMINNTYNDGLQKHTIHDHSMIPSFNNDTLTPKRTPEGRANSPS